MTLALHRSGTEPLKRIAWPHGARSRSGILSHAHPRRRRPQHLPVAVFGCVGGCADPHQSTNFFAFTVVWR